MNQNNLKFKKITHSDIEFLYEMLAQREPSSNISHKIMPSFLHHKKFVQTKPYSYWYIVIYDKTKIGTVYVTKINEIGLHIKKEFQSKILEKKILKKLFQKHPRKRYLVNVNPKNKKRIQFLKKNGFKLIQHTYELSIEKNEIH